MKTLTAILVLPCILALQPRPSYSDLPTLRHQDSLEKRWVQQRYDTIPSILTKHGYDAWIVSQREYAEDTAFRSLVSSTTTFSARRRTLFLFHTDDQVPSPLVLVDNTEALWQTLNATLETVNPGKIAINIDTDIAFSDGLHTGEGRLLLSKLGRKWASRTSSNRAIPVEVIAARVGKEQLGMYRLMMENVWAMIEEGFSEEVIEVGKTTAEDLEWWFRDTMRWKVSTRLAHADEIGTGTWFPPAVTIYRSPLEPSTLHHPEMRPGDMLHIDIGITAMNMNTDTQHLGYILRQNETAPPAGLLRGLKEGNRLQDLVRKQMVPGRTGDKVLTEVKRDMARQGLRGLIYSHPIGDYGHSAGALIGMTNLQDSVPGGGQNLVLKNYWTSVELSAETFVPEWGVNQTFPLEEDVYWDDETQGFEWVFGRQTEFHLVRPRQGGAKGGARGIVGIVAEWLGWRVARWL